MEPAGFLLKPKLIVLEGPDSTGKSTQVKLLSKRYNAEVVVQPSEDNEIGFLRNEVKNNCDKFDPFGVQCLHTISHLGDIPHKLLKEPRNWIFDRSHISTYVYGKITGLTEHQNEVLTRVHLGMYKRIIEGVYAVHVVFLDNKKRFKEKTTDKFETTFDWEKLKTEYKNLYLKMFNKEKTFFYSKERAHLVEVSGKTKQEVNDEIVKKIEGKL